MPETKLRFLGSQIRAARKRNHLTQQKLADKTGLAIKTVQETEKGKKNAIYDTLSRLIECLGISADTLFPTKTPISDEKLRHGRFLDFEGQVLKKIAFSLWHLSIHKSASKYGIKSVQQPFAPDSIRLK